MTESNPISAVVIQVTPKLTVETMNPLGEAINNEFLRHSIEWQKNELLAHKTYTIIEEDEVNKLADEFIKNNPSQFANADLNDAKQQGKRIGFIIGFNAHKVTHPFSLEQMKKAFWEGRFHEGEIEEQWIEAFDKLIQFLSPKIGDLVQIEIISDKTARIVTDGSK